MATFTIHEIPYLRHHHQRAQAAHEAATTPDQPLTMRHTAADTLTLRGIPAVGRSVAGHIAGTQPERHTCR